MEVAARSEPRALTGVLARVDARVVLGVLIGLSAVIRTGFGWLRATPNYYPDEYIYSEIARSIAATGKPLVRGVPAHFPALLQPLLDAPAWLLSGSEAPYRAVQAMDSLLFALAAIPVYLIARRLKLSPWISLAVAALTLAVPDALYSSFTVSEPSSYPLVMAAFAAALAALDRPSLRAQGLFALFAGLAAASRIQFVLLPAVYLVAVAVLALRERRLRGVLREQVVPVALLGLAVGAFVVVGLRGNFGYYPSFRYFKGGSHAVKMLGDNLLVLAYASGWVLVPGAILGIWAILRRPERRAELAFAALFLPLLLGLVVQAAYYGDTGVVQERYTFYLVPLLGIAFAVYAARNWPWRLAHGALAAVLAAAAAVFPLAGNAVAGMNTHSTFLYAVDRLVIAWNRVDQSSLAVASVATALSAAVVLSSARPRLATRVAFGAAICACVTAAALATSYDRLGARRAEAMFLPANHSWVDAAKLGDVSLLMGPGGLKTDASDQLFWNRSVTRVLALPNATLPDAFSSYPVGVRPDGVVDVEHVPVRGGLLVDGFGATIRLRDATVVAHSKTMTLWRPHGRVQLSLFMPGRFYDGWLASSGAIVLWPATPRGSLAGYVTVRLRPPRGNQVATMRLHSQGEAEQHLSLKPGRATVLRLRVCSSGPWSAGFSAPPLGFIDQRAVSARASVPVFTPAPGACHTAA